MKKLMVAIAAVATAFGLYADAFTNAWTAAGTTADTWNDGQWVGEGTNNVTVGTDVITIKTGNNVLQRQVNGTTGYDLATSNLYAEAVINFKDQALDEVPALDQTAKIAIFALDGSEITGAPAGTNFFVMAGYGESGAALFKLANTGSLMADAARKVVVKGYDKADGTRSGFVVCIDNGAVGAELIPARVDGVYVFDDGVVNWTNMAGPDYLGLKDTALTITKGVRWFKQESLFLSICPDGLTAGKLTTLDFKGNADIASVNFTEEYANFPLDSQVMYLNGNVALTKVEGALSYDASSILGIDGDTITIYPNWSKAIVEVKYGDTTITDKQASYEITFANGETISVNEFDTKATVKFEGDNEIPCRDINDALVKIAEAGAAAKITLNEDVEQANLDFASNESITLDLAGKTITLTDMYAALGNTGVLTIIDSSDPQKGKVTCDVSNTGTLNIEAGIFEGAVSNEGGKILATAGSFLQDTNEKTTIADYITDEYEIAGEEGDDYWTVVPAAPKTFSVTAAPAAPNSKLTVKVNDEDIEGKDNVYTAELGETIVVTYTADTGYEFDGQPTVTDSFGEANDTTFATAPTPTIKKFALTLPTGVNASAVVSNATEDITAALTAIDYGTKVTVYWTAAAGYKITEGATEEITMIANKMAKVPTVEAEAQPVTPGQDVEIPTGETAESYKEKINDPSTGLKEKLLVAPNDGTVPTTEAYRNLFQAVAAGDKVTFEMIPAEEAKLKAAALEDAAAALDADAGEVAITNPISGLYYGLKQANALADMAVTDKELSNGSKLSFTITVKGEDAGFWQVLIGTKESDIENPAE